MGRTAALVGLWLFAGTAWAQDLPAAKSATTPPNSAAAPALVSEQAMPPLLNPDPRPCPTCEVLPTSIDNHCCERCEGGFFAEGDYLLLKPRRRAFDFAILDPNNRGVTEGSIESLEWEFSSGFRAGGGYRLPGEGWEAGAYFTYLHSTISRTINAPPGGTIFATLTRPGGITQVDSATADCGLNYRVVDVEVGRCFHPGESVTVRVFGGGRAASIDQGLNAFYNGGDANHALVQSPIDFDGGGLRAGGEGRLNLRWGLNLYASASASLIAGEFKTRLTETNNSGATTNVNVSETFDKVVPVAEMGLGIGWEYRNWQLSAGYEIVNWFNLVDSPNFVDDVHIGKVSHRVSDLSLDGLMVRLGMTF
jgi:hypothetical protein